MSADSHKHEIDSGRTSSVGMEILGFDAKSVPVPTMSHGRNAPWDEICGKAAKVTDRVIILSAVCLNNCMPVSEYELNLTNKFKIDSCRSSPSSIWQDMSAISR